MLQICCLLFCQANAQVKNNVVKLHAYVTKIYAGNIQTDSSGNEVTAGMEVMHTIYAETTGKYLPKWNMVFTKKGVFIIQAVEIESGKQEAVKLKGSKKPVYITARRGNRLWKLELVAVKAKISAGILALLEKNDMVVSTEWNGKHFTHTIAKEIELESVFYK